MAVVRYLQVWGRQRPSWARKRGVAGSNAKMEGLGYVDRHRGAARYLLGDRLFCFACLELPHPHHSIGCAHFSCLSFSPRKIRRLTLTGIERQTDWRCGWPDGGGCHALAAAPKKTSLQVGALSNLDRPDENGRSRSFRSRRGPSLHPRRPHMNWTWPCRRATFAERRIAAQDRPGRFRSACSFRSRRHSRAHTRRILRFAIEEHPSSSTFQPPCDARQMAIERRMVRYGHASAMSPHGSKSHSGCSAFISTTKMI